MRNTKTTKSFKHCFSPSTWVKIENRARLEGKTPEAVAVFLLSKGIGLIPPARAAK